MKLHDRSPTASRDGDGLAVPVGRTAGPGHTAAVAEDGVLEGRQRLGNRLWLQISINGRRRTASMEWDPPPAVGDVEVVLRASIGAEIRHRGELEVPTGTRGARG